MNQNLGPTGEFPEGKIHESDEGELKLAVGVFEDNVVIDFGTSVSWIGFGKEQALEIAAALIEKANQLP